MQQARVPHYCTYLLFFDQKKNIFESEILIIAQHFDMIVVPE